jgi:hypothetical protein
VSTPEFFASIIQGIEYDEGLAVRIGRCGIIRASSSAMVVDTGKVTDISEQWIKNQTLVKISGHESAAVMNGVSIVLKQKLQW